MKNGLRDIIGRRIAGVVVAESRTRHPRQQVFLVFDDGTRFELYGEAFSCCSGLDPARGIASYIRSGGGRVTRVYGQASVAETEQVPQRHAEPSIRDAGRDSGDLEDLLAREVAAWNAAKALIARARGR